MGNVKIRYYVTRRAWPGSTATWGYWSPSKKMKAAGFKMVECGEDGPEAWAVAERWNVKWDAHKKGEAVDVAASVTADLDPRYPEGSVGHGYQRATAMRSAERKKNGIAWTREQESRDDWPRAWKHLGPLFGDCDPKTITPEMFLTIDKNTGEVFGLLAEIEKHWSITERHRTVKIWRALWKKMTTFGYCTDQKGERKDPSTLVGNTPPQPRSDTWKHREVLKRVQVAWRQDKKGLAACIAVAWDSMLSPVDARTLTLAQLAQEPVSGAILFEVDRAKTGKAAAGTLTQWSLAILCAYVAELKAQGIELLPSAPIFRTPGAAPGPNGGRRWAPRPYSKNQLGKDFRPVRAALDKTDTRQISDMRRSGAVEGFAGGATPADTSQKMANTLMASARLQKTYTPVNAPSVIRFDRARAVGKGLIADEQPVRGADVLKKNEGGSKS